MDLEGAVRVTSEVVLTVQKVEKVAEAEVLKMVLNWQVVAEEEREVLDLLTVEVVGGPKILDFLWVLEVEGELEEVYLSKVAEGAVPEVLDLMKKVEAPGEPGRSPFVMLAEEVVAYQLPGWPQKKAWIAVLEEAF